MKHKGFSLIELLVAMTILSMITLLAGSAFSMFAQRWEGKLGQFDESFIQTRTALVVDEVLKNIVPYVILNQERQARLYFEGNENGFVAITQRSIKYPNAPAVIRFSAVQQNNFKYSLWYEEWPMNERVLMFSGLKLDFEAPVIISTDLDNVRFDYFGLPSPDSLKVENDIPAGPKWFPAYNSFATFRHPEKIQFTLTKNESNLTQFIDLIQPTGATTSIISILKNEEENTDY